MAHYRKKHPTKVLGNRCGMCQWYKMAGNSKAELKPQLRRELDRLKASEGLHDPAHR